MARSAPFKELLRLLSLFLAPPEPPRTWPQSAQWTAAEWLTYYSECRKFLLVLGEKFSSLVAQSSVYVFAATGVVVTLKQISTPSIVTLLVITPTILALFFFWYVVLRYANQARAVGRILSTIEMENLVLRDDVALLTSLRGPSLALFNRPATRVALHLYFVLLVLVLIGVAAAPLPSPVLQ